MTPDETSRVVSFETDDGESIAIFAGTCESDKRTIYKGRLDGRYAVVPADGLGEGDLGRELPDGADPEIANMQLVGDPVVVGDDGDATVSLHSGRQQACRMDRRGAYGLLWIPFE